MATVKTLASLASAAMSAAVALGGVLNPDMALVLWVMAPVFLCLAGVVWTWPRVRAYLPAGPSTRAMEREAAAVAGIVAGLGSEERQIILLRLDVEKGIAWGLASDPTYIPMPFSPHPKNISSGDWEESRRGHERLQERGVIQAVGWNNGDSLVIYDWTPLGRKVATQLSLAASPSESPS